MQRRGFEPLRVSHDSGVTARYISSSVISAGGRATLAMSEKADCAGRNPCVAGLITPNRQEYPACAIFDEAMIRGSHTPYHQSFDFRRDYLFVFSDASRRRTRI
jgi:hypothetical protein